MPVGNEHGHDWSHASLILTQVFPPLTGSHANSHPPAHAAIVVVVLQSHGLTVVVVVVVEVQVTVGMTSPTLQ